MAYRRQAANRGLLDWATVDAALYNEAFAGRSLSVPRCKYCLADTHPSQECVHSPVESSGRQMGESRASRLYARQLLQYCSLGAWRSAGSITLQQVADAGSQTATMHTSAPNANGHTPLQSVVGRSVRLGIRGPPLKCHHCRHPHRRERGQR